MEKVRIEHESYCITIEIWLFHSARRYYSENRLALLKGTPYDFANNFEKKQQPGKKHNIF